MVHQGLERRLKSDGFIAGMRNLRRREFRGGLSECLDILPKLFVYEVVMSIGRAVRGGMYGLMILLSGQTITYVAT